MYIYTFLSLYIYTNIHTHINIYMNINNHASLCSTRSINTKRGEILQENTALSISVKEIIFCFTQVLVNIFKCFYHSVFLL